MSARCRSRGWALIRPARAAKEINVGSDKSGPPSPYRPGEAATAAGAGPRPHHRGVDDDPSGIATYSQAGAQFGFAISWTMLFSYPLMVAIQQISARIGRTTGKGIAANVRQHYAGWLLQSIVALLFVANAINIGADLGAMGDALTLLIGGPRLIYVMSFGVVCALLQVLMAYARYVAVLKWLTLALFAYFGTIMVVQIPWADAARDSSFRRSCRMPRSGRRSSPCSGPRSAPICSSGRPPRKSRTSAPSLNASPW